MNHLRRIMDVKVRVLWIFAAAAPGVMLAAAETNTSADPLEVVSLSDMLPMEAHQDYGTLALDKAVTGRPLTIGDRTFEHGLGTHAASELLFDLAGEYERFESWVGVDAAMIPHKLGSIEFVVSADGRELYRSGLMRETDQPKRVSVSVAGVQELKLSVTDGGDGISGDNADWAEPRVVKALRRATEKPTRFTVASPNVSIGLTEDGEIASILAGPLKNNLRGWTRLPGCRIDGDVVSEELPGGGRRFLRRLISASGRVGVVTERFSPTKDSIRWEVDIAGDGLAWSAPVVTALTCARPQEMRFWAAWSDPGARPGPWCDPLTATPLVSRCWQYGNVAQTAPVGGDFVSLPLVTLLAANQDAGVSLILSPEEVLLDMTVTVSSIGQVRLARTGHRLGGGRTAHLAMDLVGHEADWRGGLRWMVTRYPAFFEPPNPKIDTMAGCGAYSGNENAIDATRFKKMGFRINWKLSDDFPYMGMFIPPVKSADERWHRSCDEPAPPGKADTISCRQMNDYAKYMKENGFFVLSYFNVTEFGKNMKDREIPDSLADDPELWKDPVAFLKLRLPHGYIQPLIGTCYNAWVTDVGDPAYRDFMLDQARRHIELLPDTSGICIDRMDWLRYYNLNADDGVSWHGGQPARSLYRSWQAFMAELGPLMHKADKVILGNTMTMRLELNRELDGIYTEHGDNPGALNAAALMGVRKPVLAWTYNKTLHEPDPDSFFQRHLHLGVFPTAPYPNNHHCTVPDPWTEEQFTAYGPLLDALRGRKWVLAAHCVACVTPGVKVNLFEVPGGYVLPVTFGSQADSATVRLRGVKGLDGARFDALHPDAEAPAAVQAAGHDGEWELSVPLKRGCALVRVIKSSAP